MLNRRKILSALLSLVNYPAAAETLRPMNSSGEPAVSNTTPNVPQIRHERTIDMSSLGSRLWVVEVTYSPDGRFLGLITAALSVDAQFLDDGARHRVPNLHGIIRGTSVADRDRFSIRIPSEMRMRGQPKVARRRNSRLKSILFEVPDHDLGFGNISHDQSQKAAVRTVGYFYDP